MCTIPLSLDFPRLAVTVELDSVFLFDVIVFFGVCVLGGRSELGEELTEPLDFGGLEAPSEVA